MQSLIGVRSLVRLASDLGSDVEALYVPVQDALVALKYIDRLSKLLLVL